VKRALYAEAGVREYWIVDLGGDAIEVYRDPAAGGYALADRVGRGTVLAPVAFPDVTLAAADILG